MHTQSVKISTLIKQVIHLRTENEFKKALEVCEEILKTFPKHNKALIEKGNIIYETEGVEPALNIYLQSDEKARDWGLHYNIGCCYYMLRNYNQAIDNFTKAIELAPVSSLEYSDTNNHKARIYHYRAKCYVEVKLREKAIADFYTAIVLEPLFEDTYLGIEKYLSQSKLEKEVFIDIQIYKIITELQKIFASTTKLKYAKEYAALKYIKNYLIYAYNILSGYFPDIIAKFLKHIDVFIPNYASLKGTHFLSEVTKLLTATKHGYELSKMKIKHEYFSFADMQAVTPEEIQSFVFSLELPEMVNPLISALISIVKRDTTNLRTRQAAAAKVVDRWEQQYKAGLIELDKPTLRYCIKIMVTLCTYPHFRMNPDTHVLSHSLRYLRADVTPFTFLGQVADTSKSYTNSEIFIRIMQLFEHPLNTKEIIIKNLFVKMNQESEWKNAKLILAMLIEIAKKMRKSPAGKINENYFKHSKFHFGTEVLDFATGMQRLSYEVICFIESVLTDTYTEDFMSLTLSTEEKRELKFKLQPLDKKQLFTNIIFEEQVENRVVCHSIKEQILYFISLAKNHQLEKKREELQTPEKIAERMQKRAWGKMTESIKAAFALETRDNREGRSVEEHWDFLNKDYPDTITALLKRLLHDEKERDEDALMKEFIHIEEQPFIDNGAVNICIHFENPSADGMRYFYFEFSLYETLEELITAIQKQIRNLDTEVEMECIALHQDGYPFKKTIITKKDNAITLNELLKERCHEGSKPTLKNNFVTLNVKSPTLSTVDTFITTTTTTTSATTTLTAPVSIPTLLAPSYPHYYTHSEVPLEAFKTFSPIRDHLLSTLVAYGQENMDFVSQQNKALQFMLSQEDVLKSIPSKLVEGLFNEISEMAANRSKMQHGLLQYLRAQGVNRWTGKMDYGNTKAYAKINSLCRRVCDKVKPDRVPHHSIFADNSVFSFLMHAGNGKNEDDNGYELQARRFT